MYYNGGSSTVSRSASFSVINLSRLLCPYEYYPPEIALRQ